MTYKELYLLGKSIPQISEILGIPKSTIRFRLKKDGILRSRADGVRIAAKNGRRAYLKGTTRVFTEQWKKNISEGQKKRYENIAKGKSLKPSGYIEITTGEHKGRGEHCVIAETIIGRRLFANECVHHKNGDRSDNRPENLVVMTRSQHTSLHRRKILEDKDVN